MLEMRKAMTHHNLWRHKNTLEILVLEFGDIERGGVRQRMQVEIDQRTSGVFHRRKSLIERARCQQALEQGLRHRLTGTCVSCVFLENLRDFQPMLIELGWQFDEIAWDRRAGEQRVSYVRQHAVQRVAEFMEQRACIVEREQRR